MREFVGRVVMARGNSTYTSCNKCLTKLDLIGADQYMCYRCNKVYKRADVHLGNVAKLEVVSCENDDRVELTLFKETLLQLFGTVKYFQYSSMDKMQQQLALVSPFVYKFLYNPETLIVKQVVCLD